MIPVLQIPLPIPRPVRAAVLTALSMAAGEIAAWWADTHNQLLRATEETYRA